MGSSQYPACLKRTPNTSNSNNTGDNTNPTSIRQGPSFVAQIRHAWNTFWEIGWTLFVTQSSNIVRMIVGQRSLSSAHSHSFGVQRTLGILGILPTIILARIVSISRLSLGFRAIRVQSSKEIATSKPAPTLSKQSSPTAVIVNRLTANQSIVAPSPGAWIETHRNAYTNAHCVCPTDWTDSMIPSATLLVTKPCIQIGFVRRTRIWIRAEDFVAFVCLGVGCEPIRSSDHQSKMFTSFDHGQQYDNERNQELIHCFLRIL